MTAAPLTAALIEMSGVPRRSPTTACTGSWKTGRAKPPPPPPNPSFQVSSGDVRLPAASRCSMVPQNGELVLAEQELLLDPLGEARANSAIPRRSASAKRTSPYCNVSCPSRVTFRASVEVCVVSRMTRP